MKSFSCALLILGLVFTNGTIRCNTNVVTNTSLTTTVVQSAAQNNQAGGTPGQPSGDSSNEQTAGGSVVTAPSASQQSQADSRNTQESTHVSEPNAQNSDNNNPTREVVPGEGNSPDTTPPVPEAAQPSVTNPFAVKSALLKDHNGLKITGPCKSNFQVYLVPYLYINVNTEKNEIEMEPTFMKVDEKIKFEKDENNIRNKCGENKTFKLVIFIYDGVLTIKWKVYPPKNQEDIDKTLDIRKYKMRDSGMPITSMQVLVVTEQNKTLYVESKNYSVKNDIPEKCDALANDCFLSGILDVQKCYHCTLLMQEKQNAKECFKYISPEIRNRFDDIKTKGEDEDDTDKVELEEAIHNILKNIYKNEGENKEINKLALADNSLKQELIKYCQLLKQTDTSGVLDNHEMANEEEAFTNLTNMIEMNSNYDINDLKGKLKNVAICLHDPNEWVSSKTGLLLPLLSHNNVYNNIDIYNSNEGSTVMFKEGTDGIKDFTILESVDVSPSHMTDKLHCNDEFCDRTKDTASCMSKIEVEDHGDCALSWIFASKLHLETIKCMKGYDHLPSSALYVANCSQKEGDAKCHAASNPLEFLNILDDKQFLPSESDMPYSYKMVGDVCPKPKHLWVNLWENVKLLNHKKMPNTVGTKGYTAYQCEHFKNNMENFINIVKSEVMKKGSAIAYVKAKDVLHYNFNGKVVYSLCGGEVPDLAVNIIGYGNYINGEGVKKSYWLLRNNWGKYWGDKGNFKVDMHTPADCQHNFIHTVAVFNLDIPEVTVQTNKDPEIHNYYMKNSPDFYNNLFIKKLDAMKDNTSSKENCYHNNPVIHGESDNLSNIQEFAGKTLEVIKSLAGVAGVGAKEAAKVAVKRAVKTVATVVKDIVPDKEKKGTEKSSQVVTGEPSVAVAGGEAQLSNEQTVTTLPETNTSESDAQEAGSDLVVTQQASAAGGSQNSVPATTPKAPLSSTTGTSGVNVRAVTGVLHFLKNVKNGKVKSSLVTYNNEAAIGDAKVCSRAHSSDVEKIKDCIKFCEDKWDECKDTVSPGYCLAKKKGNNDCFFCFV
ncbi:serine-repeat antigen 3a [Plasmodium gonderi]|uniref:Serine-repeat antigen 3a n=1 Tax=Plasmodium gonderi TaxID=77519 RepID=A0A1Y1JBA1_PLAGO|nr:serine-repeat antigen 3a [Plasmodium gonderi]GAW79530.1 serine-repeat antigen 3a [Plasmodium gonderi]